MSEEDEEKGVEGLASDSDSEPEVVLESEGESGMESEMESEGEQYGSDGEPVAGSSNSPKKKENKKAAEPVKKKKSATKKKPAKKRGGIVIPDDWNWEGAKELFMNPEVIKAEDIEVGERISS